MTKSGSGQVDGQSGVGGLEDTSRSSKPKPGRRSGIRKAGVPSTETAAPKPADEIPRNLATVAQLSVVDAATGSPAAVGAAKHGIGPAVWPD